MDISVIILTYNEELHIRRCIENVRDLCTDVFVVDSFSTDKTRAIAEGLGAKAVQNRWEGLYARQFNWALAHLPIRTKWVLRLDADEYLTDELKKEIRAKLKGLPERVTGCVFPLRRVFLGRIIRRGMPSIKLLRMFHYQKAVCEQRLMDEHIQLLEGSSITFEHEFADDNLNNLSWWSQKHIGYAIREAADLLDVEYGFLTDRAESRNSEELGDCQAEKKLGEQAARKRVKKLRYARLPLFWRAFAYFMYRYIYKGGFLEGKEGFLWHFLQGWWYRTLVDAKIFEVRRKAMRNWQEEEGHREKNGNAHKYIGNRVLKVLRDEYGLQI